MCGQVESTFCCSGIEFVSVLFEFVFTLVHVLS